MNTNYEIKMLAYLGDSVFEVLVRKYIINIGIINPKKANEKALSFVTAKCQSAAVERLLPILEEDELDIYRRGKNAKSASVPKSASLYEYRLATGLEALFGYNYMQNKSERNEELFKTAFEIE